ncbi:transmembrane emp24 domain-containing protein 5-like [Atheta coriaria]|uniref:transmembrane emp24 domain-containing protein 5-like n=1 Tax=Dalotia coriaria TaxID=877792 RepID=UPI0031F3E794
MSHKTLHNIIYSLIIIFSCLFTGQCLEREMTVNVEPRKEDCFFQNVKVGDKIDIEYQVIDGGLGDLDITFLLADPNGRILAADYKKSENNHRVDAELDGDYKFCFDNTFSSFNVKTVFFEMIIDRDNDDSWENPSNLGNIPEETYELTVEEIQEAVNRVRVNLKSIRHLQDAIKSTEARDRNIAEENYFKVNTFSWVQIAVMATVGIVQVVMVRSLFDDKSKVHGIWKKMPGAR